ncbi:AraC family ligand binding domain-containing protein [Flavobacterium sp. EDS]|uniref:AraC family ligand binding domain-containing protein n=1 Tax=Flavobacterium sp. EDS TaxID=2897328 RepID=UPI001E556217|nr:AraC family ligand binding domain-containing protein [Flavobacterium sp. EDS]MCD0476309.1 AraC family ligand binding domain-containing protein [Flavobacterium sp. EDS]
MSNYSIPTLSVGNILGEETLGITLFQHSVKGRDAFEEPHKHDFYMLFFVEKGTGFHNIDFTQHTVGDNQVYFIRPGQVHNWLLNANTIGFQLRSLLFFLIYHSFHILDKAFHHAFL